MFEFFVLFAGAAWLGIDLIKRADRSSRDMVYTGYEKSKNFNLPRQHELERLFMEDREAGEKLLGEKYYLYSVPHPRHTDVPYFVEQCNIAVRKVARREGWEYYEFSLENARNGYMTASKKYRASAYGAFVNTEKFYQDRYKQEIELNGW